MASPGAGGGDRRLFRSIGKGTKPSRGAAFHRLHSFQGRATTHHEGRPLVASPGYWNRGAKVQKDLSRRKVFARRAGSKIFTMGKFDAATLHLQKEIKPIGAWKTSGQTLTHPLVF